MKKLFVLTAVTVLISQFSYAQFKEVPYETKSKLKSGNLILGFINPKNFSLTHWFSVSYVNIGGNSISLTSYTGRVSYKILRNLDLSADLTMQYSPFASLKYGTTGLNKEFQNSLTGIRLSRVSLNYRPAKNVFINLDYVNTPYNFYGNSDPYYLWNYQPW